MISKLLIVVEYCPCCAINLTTLRTLLKTQAPLLPLLWPVLLTCDPVRCEVKAFSLIEVLQNLQNFEHVRRKKTFPKNAYFFT